MADEQADSDPDSSDAHPSPNAPAEPDGTLPQTPEDIELSRSLSAQADQPPADVQGYEFVRRIGEGAYGSVWLARENNTGKNVAIKFYTHRRGLDWSLLNREVEKLAVLYTSRNIVGLLDVGWNSDPPYYVMEYLENGSLASFVADGPISTSEAVRIAKAIGNALVHAHGAGILHCDLKPANVLLDADFEPRLCDFGQSRLTHEQNPALGTLFYMASEQADLKAVPDARWDVYALGALLYHMLCGEPPHRSNENEQRIRDAGNLEERLAEYRRILKDSPPPDKHRHVAGVDRRLADIVDRCLQVDPQKRYPNTQAVLDRLDYRDRQRARRPFIAMGIVGPLLLLGAIAPIYLGAMNRNVQTLRREVTERALESDALAARIQARALSYELTQRLTELEDIAERLGPQFADDEDFKNVTTKVRSTPRAEFVSMIQQRAGMSEGERPNWFLALDKARERSNKRYIAQGHGADTSWFLTDALGYQIWRRSFSADTIGRNYAYRDYFNGLGRNDAAPNESQTFQPAGRSHMSIAFRSQASGRYMVALTVPVRAADGRLIGVLGRTAHLSELLEKFGGTNTGQVNRVIALADTREWRLLDHPWIPTDQQQMRDLLSTLKLSDDQFFRTLDLTAVADRIQQRTDFQIPREGSGMVDVRFDNYTDPVEKFSQQGAADYEGPWLAAMSPVRAGDAVWIVIVQEQKQAALEGVDEMTTDSKRFGILASAVCVLLIGLLWFFVSRAMNARGLQRVSRDEDGRSSRLTGISTS